MARATAAAVYRAEAVEVVIAAEAAAKVAAVVAARAEAAKAEACKTTILCRILDTNR